MIKKNRKPIFDFCYLDGGHTFDVTALGVSLLSILMKPGGILILDDLNWSIAKSPTARNIQSKQKFILPMNKVRWA
jgi:predicted O-methyltransferase YrrM